MLAHRLRIATSHIHAGTALGSHRLASALQRGPGARGELGASGGGRLRAPVVLVVPPCVAQQPHTT